MDDNINVCSTRHEMARQSDVLVSNLIRTYSSKRAARYKRVAVAVLRVDGPASVEPRVYLSRIASLSRVSNLIWED
jgi:hypothetical protein